MTKVYIVAKVTEMWKIKVKLVTTDKTKAVKYMDAAGPSANLDLIESVLETPNAGSRDLTMQMYRRQYRLGVK